MRVLLRNHEKGILGTGPSRDPIHPKVFGGYYNEVFSPEIASCTNGIHLTDAGNAWHIYGGRIHGNKIGIYLGLVSGNHISSSFEGNDLAIEFGVGASKSSVTSSYFEQNGIKPELGHPSGAIHFASGATFNTESENLFANNEDMIVDNDGSNISLSPLVIASPTMATGIGSGINLIPNGSFELDSNGDGLADHWVMASGIPKGTKLGIDTTICKFDGKSQEAHD